ncbi:Probably inactive leucine-rich repeat receptor-like protein kinase [Glycine soja]|uniref:Probably inactive leucine-rich repeat receptor-like protein kinase n=1 Tax=Glycine soja TaxID=3848 RepID=A0A0B2R2C2_GLYSO|nr:Probably inactive leucine-rich repeat receptor-like protein kinase [Glycine soja]
MCIQTEREALLQFKAAIEDPYGMLSSWTTSDCCQWQGIRCSNLTAHVLMLDLHGDLFNDVPQRYMGGVIHNFTSSMILQWLSNVTSNLVELDLSGNLLEGSTSNHFGRVMNSLEHLDLSYNIFKGDDFKSFANICTLRSLYATENNFSEDLPSILHNLSSGCVRHSLQDLDLSYNQITGSLPDLSVFSSLKTLVLKQNQLSGKIPEGIRLPFHLKSLSINSLEGGILGTHVL